VNGGVAVGVVVCDGFGQEVCGIAALLGPSGHSWLVGAYLSPSRPRLLPVEYFHSQYLRRREHGQRRRAGLCWR